MIHVAFKDRKMITSSQIDTDVGSFALDATPFRFETCRERFGKAWDQNTKGFYLKTKPGGAFGVAAFLQKTEAILKQSEFSQFAETNRDTIVWIEPSMFWKTCRMRRSLLTIMVRAGNLYDPRRDNYEEALFNEKFVKPTKKAVMRFLYGFTKYAGPSIETEQSIESRGWYAVFYEAGPDKVKLWLKWPDALPGAYVAKAPMSEALWI